MSYEDDVDESSIQGNQAKSSVWGSVRGDADSTVGGGLVSSPRSTCLSDDGETNNNLENSTAGVKQTDDRCVSSGKKSIVTRISSMIDNLVSRVSRSASSLLNQHSPNINDILDSGDNGTPPIQQPSVSQQQQQRNRSGSGVGIQIDSTIPEQTHTDEEVFALREEVALLNNKIQALESEKGNITLSALNSTQDVSSISTTDDISDIPSIDAIRSLAPHQVSRYSRQLLLSDGFGVTGQKQLLSSSILVISAGGIGSSVLLYLAASGVGHITIVDYDNVEMSNLHRQVIHQDCNSSKKFDEVGMNKALSAKQAMLKLNPTTSVTALNVVISSTNALELVSRHDLVVDACDNPQTRYLVNDACILANKTLVSGSAMGTEGQLTVYNYQPTKKISEGEETPQKRTACYRCLYPNPNPSEGCKSCSDNGVLGMVPGTIGILQAVEVIKIITGVGNVMHDRLLMYDSLNCSFLNIKKPPRRKNCAVCSEEEEVTIIKSMEDSAKSLENVRGPSVCAVKPHDNVLPEENKISCVKYNEVRQSNQPHVLLDVRVPQQYEMCSLDGSINLPLGQLQSKLDMVEKLSNNGELPVYCLCRRGIASAAAVKVIQESTYKGKVYNIEGGLTSWVQSVDTEFAQY